jgi:hypothetical protein
MKDMQAWSDHVAALAVDALVDAKIVAKEKFNEATKIAASEIYIRLTVGDFPLKPTE